MQTATMRPQTVCLQTTEKGQKEIPCALEKVL